ncbi:dockerin type I domain-containing protein [Neorhodopirellula lusitana]|uniref:dockerin type I domain-containing protein n=1 Tax=Neorhodopirellula lusitana TaxID=445327 RepID=UPI00384B68AA
MKSHHRKRRQRLVCEILESRQLLAGDAGFSPWTHPLNPNDTNGDGTVSAVDTLVVINQLNRAGSAELPSNARPILGGAASYYDVNGDSNVTAVDALRVINQLNQDSQVEPSEAASLTLVSTTSSADHETTDLLFLDHFARSSGVLSPAEGRDVYTFTANLGFIAIDLNSLAQESHAEARALDEFGGSLAVPC